MRKPKTKKEWYEQVWYHYLTGQDKTGRELEFPLSYRFIRGTSGLVPGKPRCAECNRPMAGVGGWLSGARPSSYSPRLCDDCENAMREEEAGAEVELSLLFADVRGSTTLAEKSTTAEFKELIQRFYHVGSDILIQHDALVNRLMGDQVIGLFVPHFAGVEHAKVAVSAALDLLRATGHEDRNGPCIPVGIGIHTGLDYVGAVGTKAGVNEIAVLGSAPNLAARLSSQAAAGEVIISEAAAASARLAADGAGLQNRLIDLKGINQPVAVRVLCVQGAPLGSSG